VQCSAHGEPRRARVANLPDGTVEVHWTEPQRRVSPGQSVVFYDLDDQWVIGGATVRPTPTRRVPAATGTPTSF
jgi:tRNA-specific 2-thiouridylase